MIYFYSLLFFTSVGYIGFLHIHIHVNIYVYTHIYLLSVVIVCSHMQVNKYVPWIKEPVKGCGCGWLLVKPEGCSGCVRETRLPIAVCFTLYSWNSVSHGSLLHRANSISATGGPLLPWTACLTDWEFRGKTRSRFRSRITFFGGRGQG